MKYENLKDMDDRKKKVHIIVGKHKTITKKIIRIHNKTIYSDLDL